MKRALLTLAAAVTAAGCVAAATGLAAKIVAAPVCAAHAPKTADLQVGTSRFLRPGAVVVHVCRYAGVNWGNSQGLVRARVIRDHATIASLTQAFNALHEPPRGIFCPRDDGSEMLVAFGYAGSRPERIVVKLSGCRFAVNGRSAREVSAGLMKRLLALAKS